jgi:NAD(P)-dependent dehydrogenase (short-subunit alcohol dehydrogenase family)
MGTGVVVITGAGTGIGRRSAEVLADDGFAVAAIGRRLEKLQGYETTGQIVPFSCDVREPERVAECIAEVQASLGPVRGLVTCAGILRQAPVEDVTVDELREHFSSNVEGTFNVIQACLDDLKSTKGSIVTLSSLLTRRPLLNATAYAITKGAIEAMTKVIAAELAPQGVRVNVVLPSLVRSDIHIDAGMAPDDYEKLLDNLKGLFPLGRVGEPDDVAGVIRYLISDESGWMTGSEIVLDGGRAIGH